MAASSKSDIDGEIDEKVFRDNFEQGDELGRGAYGSVNKWKKKKDGCLNLKDLPDVVAVKVTRKDKSSNRETENLAQVDHVNIVKYLGYFLLQFPTGYIGIIMEFCIGTLDTLLRPPSWPAPRRLMLYETSRLMKQILQGLAYLHERKSPIIHRDMKPSNILVDCSENITNWMQVDKSLLRLKLTDFGTSRCIEDMNKHRDDITVIGSLAYFSPEFRQACIDNMRTAKAGVAVDIWATGLIAFKMNMSFLPVLRNDDRSEITNNESFKVNYFDDFLSCQLRVEPDERATARKLLDHRFISDFTPLKGDISHAVETNDLAYMEKLFDSYQYNGFIKHEEHALRMAATYNKIDAAKMLLDKCGCNKAEFVNRSKAIAAAASNSNLDIIKMFVELGCDINVKEVGSHKLTALHLAVVRNNIDVVKYLTGDPKTNVNVQGPRQHTPLHIAVEQANYSIVTHLVEECNARVDIANWNGHTPRKLAQNNLWRFERAQDERLVDCKAIVDYLETNDTEQQKEQKLV